jgi:ABC-type transport system involved in multi-copper enzyme maturation permease subunit
MRPAATIAHYTLREAVHTRLALLAVSVIVLLFTASLFAQQLAITESTRFQTGLYAAGVRAAAVFVGALYVLAGTAREFDDRGLDLLLALDLTRAEYLIGRLGGYVAIGILLAVAAALPLLLGAPPRAVVQWGMSLAIELAVVIAFAQFCIVSLGHLAAAASLMAGFYLLARSLEAVRLIAANPVTGGDGFAHQVMHWTLEGLALLLPSLDAWTRTAWVTDSPADWPDIARLAGQGVLYVIMLAAASMFDFYRRDL